ncbi:MAG: DUF4149 domain-containing protein [bacterium]
MTALELLWLFDVIYCLSIVGWMGAILFFSFAVAPIIFQVLNSESAAKFVRTLFPRYYTWIAISSVLALASYTARPLVVPELRNYLNLIFQGLLIFNIFLAFYCGNSLTPAINRARDAGEAEKPRFDALHRRSVRLNVVSLLIGIICLVAFEGRKTPTSAGIVEEPVESRMEKDRQFRATLNELLEAKAKKAADRAKARGEELPGTTKE